MKRRGASLRRTSHGRFRSIRLWWVVLGVGLVAGITALGLSLSMKRVLDLNLSDGELARVGERFFRNECGNDPDKLTHWNPGEGFISLGILHMLWYPGGVAETYRQTFPDFVRFCRTHGQPPPTWIEDALRTGCPWPDRAAFYNQFDGDLARSLRDFLGTTTALQAAFAHQRLVSGLKPLLAQASIPQRLGLAVRLFWLGRSAGGVFALIDYVNFKGEGLSPKERYQGQGWGLLQVLEKMPLPTSPRKALEAFVSAAKAVLTQRVANAPDPVKERRWLPGWHKRLDTYLTPIAQTF
jgi:hypothetical protein